MMDMGLTMIADHTPAAWAAAIPSDLKLVLLALCQISQGRDEFHIEVADAARLTGMSGRHIRPCIARLEALGQLTRIHKAPKTIFRLHPR